MCARNGIAAFAFAQARNQLPARLRNEERTRKRAYRNSSFVLSDSGSRRCFAAA